MKNQHKILPVVILMAVGAFARLIPHIPNFTPLEGLTIFGAAYLGRNYIAIILPLLLIYISDFIINNTTAREYFTNNEGIVWFSNYMIFNIISLILIVLISRKLLKTVNFKSILFSALAASIIFFLISNFGALFSPTSPYSKDVSGLLASYMAGIPFFRTSLLSNLFFTAIIFGSYNIILSLFYSKSLELNAREE